MNDKATFGKEKELGGQEQGKGMKKQLSRVIQR